MRLRDDVKIAVELIIEAIKVSDGWTEFKNYFLDLAKTEEIIE